MTATASLGVTFDLDALRALQFSRPRDMISLHRFAERMHYDLGHLEALSHVAPGSARANPFSRRVQAFMRAALEVVSLRMLQAADLESAIAWFKSQPLPEFGGRTPEDIVADGDQRVLLRDLPGAAAELA